MPSVLLLFARDPGGANAIAPLVSPLRDRGHSVRLFGKDAALSVYARYGLQCDDIADFVNKTSLEDVRAFVQRERPDVIVTGTSADDATEKYMWRAAGELGIPSFAILDQWINYGVRFSPYGVSELNRYRADRKHPYLPARILVMDEYAKAELAREGIDEDVIIVTGQPFFEHVMKQSGQADILRRKHGINGSQFLVTFVSEPISEVYDRNDTADPYLGYTEKSIFLNLARALEQVSRTAERKITCLIRLHPKENPDSYESVLRSFAGSPVTFIVDQDSATVDVIAASQLICGMYSMFLIEALLQGKPVVSIQIGLKRESPFVLDRRGIVDSIRDQAKLNRTVENIIQGEQVHAPRFNVIQEPIARVVQLVEEQVCRH